MERCPRGTRHRQAAGRQSDRHGHEYRRHFGPHAGGGVPGEVEAVVNMSPNIAINEPMVGMLDEPWGLMIARTVRGGKYNESHPENPEKAKYWYTKYRLEAVVELENLVDHAMKPELFARIHQPVLNLYYYKNEKSRIPRLRFPPSSICMKSWGRPGKEARRGHSGRGRACNRL